MEQGKGFVDVEKIEAPKGGSLYKGLGENCSVKLFGGEAVLHVPLPFSPAREQTPALELTYRADAQNGVFGKGFSLNLPQICRKTSERIPRYDAGDVFLYGDGRELVEKKSYAEGSTNKTLYGFRKEEDFTTLVFCDDGADTWWEAVDREGVRYLFGRSAASRIADAGAPKNVYAWLVCESVDTKGNQIGYTYTEEGNLSMVSYGNYIAENGTKQWLFRGVFRYREREDCFRSCRAGFMRKTGVLCDRFSMYHWIDGEFTNVNYLEFDYDSSGAVSLLTKITKTGVCRDRQESIELLTLSYEALEPEKACVRPIHAQPSQKCVMADLYGEGAAGIVYYTGDDVLYAEPLGENCFGEPKALENFPVHRYFEEGACSLESLNVDGKCSLVVKSDSLNGYYLLEEKTWNPFQPFRFHANEERKGLSEYADLEGDRRRHLFLFQKETGKYYPNQGIYGVGVPKICPLPKDFPHVTQNNEQELVTFLDILGDGLSHRVRIRNGSVEFWPCLGYGKFGERMEMEQPPVFPENWKASRLHFADVNGTGTTDFIYVDGSQLYLYSNMGCKFAKPVRIALAETVCDEDQVFFADINGTGSACMIVRRCGVDGEIWGIDLSGEKRPYLLKQTENLLGVRTSFSYESATALYLADKRAGKKWDIHPPFPIPVLVGMEITDAFADSSQCVEYRYRDGLYDCEERRFYGFGLAEEKKYLKKVAADGVGRESETCRRYWHYVGREEKGGFADKGRIGNLQGHIIPMENCTEAQKSLYGECIREEVYAGEQAEPVQVKESRYEVRKLLEPSEKRRGSFAVFLRQTLETDYEDAVQDPVLRHHFFLERDDYGNVLRECEVCYPRRIRADGEILVPERVWEKQRLQKIRERQASYINLVNGDRRLGICAEEKEFLREFPGENELLTEERLYTLLTEREGETLSWKRYFYWDCGQKEALPLGQSSVKALLHHVEQAVLPIHSGILSDSQEKLLSEICGCQDREGMWWQNGTVCHYYGCDGFYLPWYEEDIGQKYRTELCYDSFWHKPAKLLHYEENGEPDVTSFLLNPFPMEYSEQKDCNDKITRVAFSPLGFVEEVFLSAGEEQILSEYTYDYGAWKRSGEPAAIKERVSRAPKADSAFVLERLRITYWDGRGKELERKYPLQSGSYLVTDKYEYNGNGVMVLQFPGYETKEEEYAKAPAEVLPIRYEYDYAGRRTRIGSPLSDKEKGDVFYAFQKSSYHPWQEERQDRNQTLPDTAFFGGTEVLFKDGMGFRLGQILVQPGKESAMQELNALLVHDAAGRLCGISDGRLLSADAWIMRRQYDLCGRKIKEVCADSGDTITLYDAWGKPVWTRDANGIEKRFVYDGMLRHTATFATGAGMTEKIEYGKNIPEHRAGHLVGKVWRYYDQAGLEENLSYSLGGVAKRKRIYCKEFSKAPDWSQEMTLEQLSYVHEYEYDCDANVTVHSLPDKRSYVFRYDYGGQLKEADCMSGGSTSSLIQDILYQDKEKKKTVLYGSGARADYGYDVVTRKLQNVNICDAEGHSSARLSLEFDAEENLLRVSGDDESICRDGNVVRALWEYEYDWNYRLVQAKGREAAGDEQDLQNLLPYTESYSYDASGNLTQIRHRGSSERSYVRDIRICSDSNRISEIETSGKDSMKITAVYDACGNTLRSSAKGKFFWNQDNRLAQAVLLERQEQKSDIEYYIYNHEGNRERKVTVRQKNEQSVEITDCRRNDGFCSKTVSNKETLTKTEWTEVWCQKELLATLYGEEEMCFPIETYTGCIQFEADGAGQVLSVEEYYPFGGTAIVRKRPQRRIERLRKFCGKEYDANTGLYYYGARYYNPNEGRMHSPDDTGYIDEERWQTINRYMYCRGNPVTLRDKDGHDWEKWVVAVVLFCVLFVGLLYCNGYIGATRGIWEYKEATKQLKGTGMQAHHLEQKAAFIPVIKAEKGLCIGLWGNAFRDVGSEHYIVHKYLEKFYDFFRKNNITPKVKDYCRALWEGLHAAGLSIADCSRAVRMMVKHMKQYNLNLDSFIPRVPGRMPQRKE